MARSGHLQAQFDPGSPTESLEITVSFISWLCFPGLVSFEGRLYPCSGPGSSENSLTGSVTPLKMEPFLSPWFQQMS